MKKSEIKLTGLQIKSLRKAKLLALYLGKIEEEFGIKDVIIEMDDCFVCPDIDLHELSTTPMEGLLKRILFNF